MMTPNEQIAEAVLDGDGLLARSLVQDFVRDQPVLVDIPQPQTTNHHLLAMTASLLELLRATNGANSADLDGIYWSNGYTCVFGAGGAKNETVA